MSRIHCSQCGQTGHNRTNRHCLVNVHQRNMNVPFVIKWVFPRSTSHMTPANRERIVRCRNYLSQAIDELTDMTQYIHTYHSEAIDQLMVQYIIRLYQDDILTKLNLFCHKINKALEYDSADRPIISTAPIFTYLMRQISQFNEINETIHTRLQVTASLHNRIITWAFRGYEEPPTTPQHALKSSSAYFKEMSFINDFTIAEDAPRCDCPLCFDAFPATDVLVTNCNHSFCVTCIKGFATANKDKTKKPECPMCRTDLTEFKVGNQQIHNEISEHLLNL